MKKENIRSLILSLPRPIKRIIVIAIDSSLSCLAVWFSYYLRIGDFLPIWERVNEHYPLHAWLFSIFIFIPIFIWFNLYRIVFRYSGYKTIITIIKAIGLYSLFYITILTIIGINGVPRTIGIIQPLIFLLLICISRLFALYFLGGMKFNQLHQSKKTRALIFGTSYDVRQLIFLLEHNTNINIVGFLDDDSKLYGSQIDNLTIYDPTNIKNVIIKKNINEIILILSHVNRHRRNEIVQSLRGENVIIRTLPSYKDVIDGNVTLNNIKELSVGDILGREPVQPNSKLLRLNITNKIVMVTGAGGSIGSELCRQIIKLKPKILILFDHSEFALYKILEELKLISTDINQIDIIPCLGSICNEILVQKILIKFKPETIFNAAAYKHVPLLEINKLEGLNNNIFGTLVLAKAAIKNNVKIFTQISSDKAVRPTNIMGASKRFSEMVIQSLSEKQNKTQFSIVRFGNVLDSSGSVVPLFKKQIKSDGPITLTHLDMTRYFMTISEAAELVIQAAAIKQTKISSTKPCPVYILDMGNPIKIYDLAKLMIELSGLTVFDKTTNQGDIEIKITGIRSGEKLHEELLIGRKKSDTIHNKIKYAYEDFPAWEKLNRNLLKIADGIKNDEEELIIKILKQLVTGFNPKL